ncbi:hypothetical protein QBC46DRAFT_396587 [Diplogelasinospora grovesii]|uniref:Uncharacterized protein n=1 Tax=Diplogelasinospora grovesii TaxID=303347 RepID=A0AAN6N1P8_9PEZI|nr:hypothetical protein QBC46DRAFT_396587 [Diplogelasinospora grovesii]
MADNDSSEIQIAPPPWKCKATAYMIPFWTSSRTAANLPTKAYHPLEAASTFASPDYGTPVGGLSMIQILRYTESPVGPYDELLIVPGTFVYPFGNDADGTKGTKKGLKLTRIYVSQKHTCYNGRQNWNIPKHLARFEWTDLPNGATRVQVYPPDTNANEGAFFQCTFQKSRIPLPSFPCSVRMLSLLGVETGLVQPPLPEGESGELVGTKQWCRAVPIQYASRTSFLWADMQQQQQTGENGDAAADGCENFWPGLNRWNACFKMTDATIEFGDSEVWDTPRHLLSRGE